MIVLDGENAVAGRLASFAAKKALQGEDIVIVNIEKAVISGEPVEILSRYRARRQMQNKADPDKSAKWPRRPDFFFKTIVRGMLPKHNTRGKQALARVKAFIGEPAQFKDKKQRAVRTSSVLARDFISLSELCQKLGWQKRLP